MTWRLRLSMVLVVVVVGGTPSLAKTRRDTYLEAYMDSHGPSSLPPGEVYGAPAPGGGYSYPAPAPAPEPHSAPDNPLDPVHAKLILLFKVLLKLLVFKLLVKFIAIICVLFFLPKLSGLGLARADGARRLQQSDDSDRLETTRFVLEALVGPPDLARCQGGAGDTAPCRLMRALRFVEDNISIQRYFGIYLKHEEDKLRHKVI